MFDPDFKVVSFFGTPMCTDKDTYAEWRDAARRSPPGDAGFCTDCTPDYQERMISEGRCENTWIKFHMHEESEAKHLPTEVVNGMARTILELSDKGIVGYIPSYVKRAKRPRP